MRGSSVVSALASGARGPGFDPSGREGNISVSEHAFLCRDDTKISAPSFGSGRKLGAPCRGSRLKNPTVIYIIT